MVFLNFEHYDFEVSFLIFQSADIRLCQVFVCYYLYFYANRLHTLHPPPSASRSGGVFEHLPF